ncbi:MAG TPA: hypothetical protein HPP83_13145 [Candidatus Hydrogenedentes bacterium]|nr:hypothetical protein [Candidatus Hydrogenedentota bacterium]
MHEEKHRPSLALTLGSWALFVLNASAAVSGVLLVTLIRSELKHTGGEKWGFLLVPPWSLGGAAVTAPLLAATVLCVACARERLNFFFRWLLLLLVLIGMVFHLSPYVPEFGTVTAPLVEAFD